MAENTFVCCECEEPADSLELLRKHLTVEHLQWIPYECVYCNVHKPTETELRFHISQRHPSQKVKVCFNPEDGKRSRLEDAIRRSSIGGGSTPRCHAPTPSPGGAPRVCTVTPTTLVSPQPRLSQSALEGALGAHSRCPSEPSDESGAGKAHRRKKPKAEIVTLSDDELEPAISFSDPVPVIAASRSAKRQPSSESENEQSRGDQSPRAPTKRQSSAAAAESACGECGKLVNVKRRSWHIFSEHMHTGAFGCSYCAFKTNGSRANVQRHIRRVHVGRPANLENIVSTAEKCAKEVARWLRVCFDRADSVARGKKENKARTRREQSGESSEPTPPPKKRRSSAEPIAGDDQSAHTGPLPEDQWPPAVSSIAPRCTMCDEVVRNGAYLRHVRSSHLQPFTYSCSECSFSRRERNSLVSHIKLVHRGQARLIDRARELAAETEAMASRCFPLRAAPPPPPPADTEQQACALCRMSVRLSQRWSHMARRHLEGGEGVGCPHCSFAHVEHGVVLGHLVKEHDDTDSGVVDLVEKMMEKCFPQPKTDGEPAAETIKAVVAQEPAAPENTALAEPEDCKPQLLAPKSIKNAISEFDIAVQRDSTEQSKDGGPTSNSLTTTESAVNNSPSSFAALPIAEFSSVNGGCKAAQGALSEVTNSAIYAATETNNGNSDSQLPKIRENSENVTI